MLTRWPATLFVVALAAAPTHAQDRGNCAVDEVLGRVCETAGPCTRTDGTPGTCTQHAGYCGCDPLPAPVQDMGQRPASQLVYKCSGAPREACVPGGDPCASGTCEPDRVCSQSIPYDYRWELSEGHAGSEGRHAGILVRVRLTPHAGTEPGTPTPSPTPEQVATAATAWDADIESNWAGVATLRVAGGTDPAVDYPVRVHVELVTATDVPVDHQVDVYASGAKLPDPGRPTSKSWQIGMASRTAAHEFGHLIGAFDDYLSGFRDPAVVRPTPPAEDAAVLPSLMARLDAEDKPLQPHFDVPRQAIARDAAFRRRSVAIQIDGARLAAILAAGAGEPPDGPPAGGVGFCPVAPPAPVGCRFDTDADGTPDLIVQDVNGDGRCEFPEGKTHLRGHLRFTADTPVEFTGKTVVEADAITIEQGGLVVGVPDRLRALTMVALAGPVEANGMVDVSAGDDVVVSARRGDLVLGDWARLAAVDRLVLEARAGSVRAETTAVTDDFSLFARNRLEVLARGANGRVRFVRTRAGARTILVDTRANVSVIGEKGVGLLDGSELTTNPAKTGLPGTGDVRIQATGSVDLVNATIDSGRNLVLATARALDDACLSGGSVLQARTPAGQPARIYLTGIRGTVFDDGTVDYAGALFGPPLQPGVCLTAP